MHSCNCEVIIPVEEFKGYCPGIQRVTPTWSTKQGMKITGRFHISSTAFICSPDYWQASDLAAHPQVTDCMFSSTQQSHSGGE